MTGVEPVAVDGGTAAALLAALRERGWTVATAESLTGGQVAARLVDVPGASRALRGGVVAYATDAKAEVLGVDATLLAAHGAVHPEVARQMAERVRPLLRADVGLSTTGVAGPEQQDGNSPGTVHVAVATPAGTVVRTLALTGDRAAIRTATCDAVLREALAAVSAAPAGEDPGTPGAATALWRS
ncbi:CinA family protein [Cellulomonas triticagri]|uniref:CinA family protein n=1 Tax=Cellulomonas triticagri TaxID=2483352 RepID=UPI0026B6F82E